MTASPETVGFVGTGLMGHGMAKNIVEKGYPLTVIAHRNRGPVEDLVSRGATEAASLADLAARSTVVVLCLTASPQVRSVVDAMKASLKPGSVVIDCSTADPTVTVEIADELAALGVYFCDAPLGRTPKEAWAGMLDSMVGAHRRCSSGCAR